MAKQTTTQLKPIILRFEEQDYTLEFDRKTTKALEQSGFDISALSSQTLSQTELLFWGAFRKNHPKIRRAKTDEILRHVANVDELVPLLIELYYDPISAVLGDENEAEKNVSWTQAE